jgi:DNA-binding response OmpR family regulator
MKHSILIIDDDTLILNTLRNRFATWDIEVYSASTPDEAKIILEKITPDLLLLDLLLTQDEGSSGIMDYLKSQDRLSSVPVLVLTNLDKPELKQILLEQGVKEYIIKGSISLDELYNKVVSYLEPKNK